MSTNISKPVKLQVNDSGSWRNVIRFDVANMEQCGKALEAGNLLTQIATRATVRIVIDDSFSTVLMRWSEKLGWVNA